MEGGEGKEMRGERRDEGVGFIDSLASVSLSLNSFRFGSGTLPRFMGTALQI